MDCLGFKATMPAVLCIQTREGNKGKRVAKSSGAPRGRLGWEGLVHHAACRLDFLAKCRG